MIGFIGFRGFIGLIGFIGFIGCRVETLMKELTQRKMGGGGKGTQGCGG